ncbi:MAG: outer membrane protein [Gammaproteobacteria bacterium]
MQVRTRFWLLLAGILTISTALADESEEWEHDFMGARFALMLGGFYPKLNTTVRVDSPDGIIGTTVDFESSLGLDDTELLPMALLKYRFNGKHAVELSYFDLERSGLGISDVEIRFGDITFGADLPLNAFFDVTVYNLAYSYSLVHDPKKEFSLSVGLNFQDISAGIIGQSTEIELVSEDASFLAPLPTFGLSGGYAFTDSLLLSARGGIFAIEIDLDDGEFSGRIVELGLQLSYKLTQYFAMGIGYNYFDVDVDIEDTDWTGELDYRYNGPMLTAGVYF